MVRFRFGFRVPSLSKRIAARTSIKRLVKNKLGLRAPRGWGWITNPRKAAYNRIYSRTTRGCLIIVAVTGLAVTVGLLGLLPCRQEAEMLGISPTFGLNTHASQPLARP
jgi:hypothetical protein